MISKETRYRAVVHYTHFLRSLRKVSAIYKVSKSSLQRCTSQDLNVVHAKRRRRSIFQKVESIMKDTIRSNPFITLHDLSHHISHECNITSSRQTMGRCRQNCGFVRKKVTRVVDVSADTTHATRVDDFCDRHVQKSISGNIVCIDEAGFVVGDHHRYVGLADSVYLTIRRLRFSLIP
jgi:transposase